MTKREILDTLKFDIEKISSERESIAKGLNISENDVRINFFGLFQTVIDEYYLGFNTCIFFETVNQIEIFEQFVYKNEIEFLENHIRKLFAIRENPILKNKYINNLEKGIILGTFATFEACVNLIFNKICDKTEFQNFVISKIKKEENSFLKQNDFNETQKEIIIDKLFDKLTLHKKFRYLTEDKYEEGFRNQDLDFILFLSNYRNCIIHSNVISNSNNNYEYFDSEFIFKKNETIKIKKLNENEFSFTSWNISYEVKNIFIRLIKNIDHNEIIEYPK